MLGSAFPPQPGPPRGSLSTSHPQTALHAPVTPLSDTCHVQGSIQEPTGVHPRILTASWKGCLNADFVNEERADWTLFSWGGIPPHLLLLSFHTQLNSKVDPFPGILWQVTMPVRCSSQPAPAYRWGNLRPLMMEFVVFNLKQAQPGG